MTTFQHSLAKAFAVIAESNEAIENKANAVIGIIRQGAIHNEKDFSLAIRSAYALNGWNVARGKPAAGVKLVRVPSSVKQYASQIRAAFRAKLKVSSFKTFHELRKALNESRERVPVLVQPELAGLRLVQKDELNGAPFHDLTVMYGKLDKTKQHALLHQVNRLLRQFAPAAEVVLKKAA